MRAEPIDRAQAVEALRQLALIGELLDETPERSAALRRAARALASLSATAWNAWLGGAPPPPALAPALGDGLRERISGPLALELETQMLRVPPGIFEMLSLRGLGLARVRRLWRESNIVTVQQVRRAALRGRLAGLPGFGPRLQARLLEEIRRLHRAHGAWLRQTALEAAERRGAALAATHGIERIACAGELRRGLETVSRLVWVAAAEACEPVLGRLVADGAEPLDETGERLARRYPEEPPHEIIVVEPERVAARLFLETGAPAHVAGVLERLAGAWEEGWLPASEEEIYARARLAPIPPELREGRGEIEAASRGELPRLLEYRDLRGAFHLHTTWSDGRATIAELAEEALRRGWTYAGIADHSQAAFYARGLDAARLAAQAEEIAAARRRFPALRIFHGVECDIQPDGSLDLPEAALARLDYVIVSVHHHLQLPREEMTQRLVRAVGHPCATILGHPSGRLLLEREAYAADWEAVFDAAAAAGTLIEFNTSPQRLDLDWRLIRSATRRGIRLAIDPDAHGLEMLEAIEPALATARKGWLTPEQVLNTRSATHVGEVFDARRRRCRQAP